MAAAGQDDDFAKDPRILAVSKLDTPPFYAVVGSTTAMNPGLCQTCGLDIDDEHHVLDFDLRPTPASSPQATTQATASACSTQRLCRA